MKPYALKNFSKEYLKDENIQDVGVNVWTDCSNIKKEYWGDYEINEDGYTEFGDDFVNIWLDEVDTVCIDPCKIDYCMGSDFDEWMFKDFINSLMKFADYYLVCAYNSNWLRQTGYKIVDDVEDAFRRNYDVSQYYRGGSSGGKSIMISEFHHDCPMGHSTMIIGLTEKEFNKLDNSDFETVIKFADKHSDSIIEI